MTPFTIEQLCARMGTNFSDRQLDAITAPLEPAVVMAGAGSGKTSVMTARIVWLVATGVVQAHEVLGLTFTNKAAAEFRSRVRSMLGDPALGIPFADAATVATYHSFAQQLVIDDGIRIGIEPEVQLLSDVRREQLATRVVRRPCIDIVELSHSSTSIVKALLSLDDRMAEEGIEPAVLRDFDARLLLDLGGREQQASGRDIMSTARKRLELVALVEQFRAIKVAQQAIDYPDMVRLALRIVSERPDVVTRLRTQYRIVLLDEYQDTSVAQRLLMQGAFGDGHPVMAVGDALQAIYEWRGASAVNIIDFPRDFPIMREGSRIEAPVFGLPVTQRFGSRIAALANDITDDLRPTLAGVEPLEAADDERHGAGVIDVALHADAASEFAWIAEQLRAAHPATAWEDMAVLLREHRHEAAVYEALTAAGIPAHIVGKQGLLGVPDIADIVAYLRVLHDPAANPSWVRILAGMRYRLGVRDIAHLGQRARALAAQPGMRERGWQAALAAAAAGSDSVDLVALGDAVGSPGDDTAISSEARARLAELDTEVRSLRRHLGLPIGELVRLVIHRIGLDVEVMASDRAVDRGRRAVLEAFLELVHGFMSLDMSQSLSEFLRWLDDGDRLDQQAQLEAPRAHGSVRIMTVHAAKGLQFEVVALPALVEGVFPKHRAEQAWPTNADAVPYALLRTRVDADLLGFPGTYPTSTEAKRFRESLRPRKLAEETRLAYVAVTRAERRVIATAARSYDGKECEPSRFLLQVRAAAESRGGTVHLWTESADAAGAQGPVAFGWPQQLDPEYAQRLRAAAQAPVAVPVPSPEEAAVIAQWDAAIAARAAEVRMQRASIHVVPIPTALTATQVQRLTADPGAFLMDIVRPMPRQPAFAAKRGSAFHAWIEAQFGGQLALGDELFAPASDDVALTALQEAFERSEWARRTPHAIELPFTIAVGGHCLRGRIDAVYRDEDRYIVVDWKTNARASSDPVQLAVYRRAAAQHFGVSLDRVRACFVYVAQGRTEWHDADIDLEALLVGSVQG